MRPLKPKDKALLKMYLIVLVGMGQLNSPIVLLKTMATKRLVLWVTRIIITRNQRMRFAIYLQFNGKAAVTLIYKAVAGQVYLNKLI